MITATRPWTGPPVTLTGREPTAPDWRDDAACLAVDDPEIFYPLGEPGSKKYEAVAEIAKALCSFCPVIADCLEDALQAHDKWAIRGGLDPTERGEQFGIKRGKRKRVAA